MANFSVSKVADYRICTFIQPRRTLEMDNMDFQLDWEKHEKSKTCPHSEHTGKCLHLQSKLRKEQNLMAI